jgi:hypothetical protein
MDRANATELCSAALFAPPDPRRRCARQACCRQRKLKGASQAGKMSSPAAWMTDSAPHPDAFVPVVMGLAEPSSMANGTQTIGRYKRTYLYRTVDSRGDTIDFMLSRRDLTAARLFLRLALSGTGSTRPRVINVDGHTVYARAISALKQSGELGRRCHLPTITLFEQHH